MLEKNQFGKYNKEGKNKARCKKIAKVIGESFLALNLLTIGASEIITGDPFALHEAEVGIFFDWHGEDVSQQNLDNVREILNSPDSKEITDIRKEDNIKKLNSDYRDYVMKKGEELGFTMVDSRPYENLIKNAGSIERVLGIGNEFFEKFGFNVSIPTKSTIRDIFVNFTPFNNSEISLEKTKTALLTLVGSLYAVPTELIKLTELKEIKLIKALEDTNNPIFSSIDTYGETNPLTKIVYLTMDDLIQEGFKDVTHEIYHLLDLSGNGLWGMIRDPEFKTLNSENFEYGVFGQDLTETFSEYGLTDVVEDKAEIGEYLINELNYSVIYSTPKVTEKSIFLLARMEKQLPVIVEYLRAISSNG